MVGADGALPLPWLGAWLESALRTQRGHAVLIHGPQGIGQWQLSLTLAQAWLCEGAQGARRPCGTCASCRLVQARSHPDLLVLIPEALQAPLGWMLADSEGEGAEGEAEAGALHDGGQTGAGGESSARPPRGRLRAGTAGGARMFRGRSGR